MSSKIYPEGSGTPQYSNWAAGILKFFRRSDSSEFMAYDPTNRRVTIAGLPRTQRFHVAIADVNSGLTLVAAEAGHAFRVVDCSAIAIGGAVGTVTTVDILGTQSTGVKLVAFGQAALTQSTLVRMGSSGGVILADGASNKACDTNTAITIGKTGSSADTATFIDVILTYVVD